MKTNSYIFGILFVGLFLYLGLNHFQVPVLYIFDKTENTKATVTKIDWVYGMKGGHLQFVTYQYQVEDSIYEDTFKAGRKEGLQTVGDKVLIEYAIKKPGKNKVMGFYPKKAEPLNSKSLN